MSAIVSIVEGDGEVVALPILLRRLNEWLSPSATPQLRPPIRVRRDQFLNKPAVFEKQLKLAASFCGEAGWILILLDADDDCPRMLADDILARARLLIPHRRISVVLANREFEAWFIAAAPSLHGRRGFVLNEKKVPDAESVRGAKEWVSEHIRSGKYAQMLDQPAFAAVMDLQQAHDQSRSFRKLCAAWTAQMAVSAP